MNSFGESKTSPSAARPAIRPATYGDERWPAKKTTSADESRGIIINYGSFHFKQTGVVQESAQALERRGCPLLEDPETRQLLGLSAVNGTNRYDSAYVRAHPMPDVR